MTDNKDEKVEATETSENSEKSSAPSQEKPKRDEKDTTAYNLRKQADRARELGLDPAEILGVKSTIKLGEEDEDSKQVTVGMLREISRTEAQKTALARAEEITDAETREAVKKVITTQLRPSEDHEGTLRTALSLVNAEKNKQVLAEVNRYSTPKRTGAGGSMPATIEEEFKPTAEEQRMMQPPYNLSKEKIIAARKRTADRG